MNITEISEKLFADDRTFGLARRSRADDLQAVEAEIRREKAEVLGRAGERLEQALNDLEGVNEMIARIEGCPRDSSSLPEETATLRQAHANLKARLAVLRDRARLAHEYLLIQREAVGVRSHFDVERSYKVSERLG